MTLYIFDLDHTIRKAKSNPYSPNFVGDQEILPGRRERLASLRAQGHILIAASNQGGVACGYLTYERAVAIAAETNEMCGNVFAKIYLCPHSPKGDCECRKPKPGMLLQAMAEFGFSPSQTIMVGDMISDKEAAEAAGIEFIWIKEFFSEKGI